MMIQNKSMVGRWSWASQFCTESGLNCGRYGFATKGLLTGPNLEEFWFGKAKPRETLHASYTETRTNQRTVKCRYAS